ncbi:MAG: hypothetical protein PF484_15190 [Bacteroidales bacterium]|jgi:hypothetical protein|nr:hypothetical protein [Bacteroidales bacterium]
MKKIIYLFAVVGLIFTSACTPMEDIHTEIDAIVNPIVGDATFTLTDEDYDALDLGYGSFSNLNDAKTLLPPYLKDKYPVWGKNSSALVGFKLYVGNAPGVSDYTYSDSYQLVDEDYADAGADASIYNVFTATSPASRNLPAILAARIDAPASGDIILAEYKYADEPSDPSVIHNMVSEDYMLIVDRVANHTDPAVSSLVSSYGDSELYTGAGAYYSNFDTRLYKREGQADYDALTTEEEQIAFVNERVQVGIVWFLKDKFPNAVPEINGQTVYYSITYLTYNGENITYTVIYKCTAAGADPEFELVEESGVDVEYQASTITENRGDFYTYTGSEWKQSSNVIFLSSGDFDSMGEAYGQPGYYNNFGSSISPDGYVPTFLNINYPYALDDDELFVIYDYYSSSSGAQLRGNLYTVVDGGWNGYQSTISTTLQFGHDGNVWVPDNTIKYTLGAADYSYIVDAFSATYPAETGNMDSYGNFNMFSWTDDMVLEVIGAVILNNFPGMSDGQKFNATFSVYDGSTHDVTLYIVLQGGVYVNQ